MMCCLNWFKRRYVLIRKNVYVPFPIEEFKDIYNSKVLKEIVIN